MKKTLHIVKTVLVWLLVVAAVAMMAFTILSVATFDRNDRGIFGFKFFVVQTDSMKATDFSAGDLAISRSVDPKTLQPGDIITFLSQDPASFGETVTHKIRALAKDANGQSGFITYGTTTDTDDETVVTYPYIIGKYVGHVPGIGAFFLFLKTTPGYLICIFVPLLLLILYQGLKVVKVFRRYRKEQLSEMEQERKKIEEERQKSAEMVQKLQELQAQLNQLQNGVKTEPPLQTEEPQAQAEEKDVFPRQPESAPHIGHADKPETEKQE